MATCGCCGILIVVENPTEINTQSIQERLTLEELKQKRWQEVIDTLCFEPEEFENLVSELRCVSWLAAIGYTGNEREAFIISKKIQRAQKAGSPIPLVDFQSDTELRQVSYISSKIENIRNRKTSDPTDLTDVSLDAHYFNPSARQIAREWLQLMIQEVSVDESEDVQYDLETLDLRDLNLHRKTLTTFDENEVTNFLTRSEDYKDPEFELNDTVLDILRKSKDDNKLISAAILNYLKKKAYELLLNSSVTARTLYYCERVLLDIETLEAKLRRVAN